MPRPPGRANLYVMSKAVGLEIHSRGIRAIEVGRHAARSFKILRYYARRSAPARCGGAPDPDELAGRR